MGNFFVELKRRHIYRVAATYVVVAWVAIQAVNNLAPMLRLPDWVGTFVVVVLFIGFPVALVFAWIGELKTPEGARASTGIFDWVLMTTILVMIGIFAYQQLSPVRAPTSQQADVEPAPRPTGISVAVLPFVNLSSDKEQEFFSDGITEEITAALAKLPELRVVARTSAFEFKGKSVNIRSVGDQLGATHLIEGSVRKAGDKLRITAQLIKASDGTHIWAEDYDRELTDVFAIQEEIARAIATSLRTPLGLKPGENLVNNRNIDPDSHEKILRAKAIYDGRDRAVLDYAQTEALLREVIAKYPDYARAWDLLSAVYFERANNLVSGYEPIAATRTQVDELRTKGEDAAQRAIQADPNLASAYARLGVFLWSRFKLLESEQLFAKALSLDPADAYTLDAHSVRLAIAGRLQDALAIAEKAHVVEPFQPGISRRFATYLWLNGKDEAALALAKTFRPTDRAPLVAAIYTGMGRYSDGADALLELTGDPSSNAAQAARLLRTAPVTTASSEALPRLSREFEFIYLSVGAPDRVLGTYERMAEIGYVQSTLTAFVWQPSYAPVRKTERFKTLMRKVGLVEYWRAKGWPEQCRPTTGDDFECN